MYPLNSTSGKLLAAIFLVLCLTINVFSQEKQSLPATPEGKVVVEYLSAFNSGDESAMRAFLLANVSEKSLLERPVEARLECFRMMRSDMQSLELHDITSVRPDAIGIVARTKGNEFVSMEFGFEANHKLAGIRIEAGGPPPQQSQQVEPGPPLTRDEFILSVEKMLEAQVSTDKFSGVVLIAKDGKPFFNKAYGFAEKQFNAPNRIDTKFNLGSINKIFTRIAIGQLAKQGKLSLDDPLIKQFPAYPNKPIAEKVTIRQLLEMTSGLGDFFDEEFDESPKEKIRTLQDYLTFFVNKPLEFEPGIAKRYSNAGYIVLGLVIEQLSGTDYYSYVRDHIYLPAGMTNTDWYEMDSPTTNRATGYLHPEGNARTWISNVYSAPARGSSAGGGYSTAEDLLKFIVALQDGKLLSAEYTDWILGKGEPVKKASSVSNASDRRPEKRGGFGIAGGAPGINAAVEYNAETGYCIIVLGNYAPPAVVEVSQNIRGLLRRVKQ